jgi:hypothetical protein
MDGVQYDGVPLNLVENNGRSIEISSPNLGSINLISLNVIDVERSAGVV